MEIVRYCRVDGSVGKLQWGHERALVEMALATRMRIMSIAASMGPRARARGNAPNETACPLVPALQWGHERALVEIKRA